MTSANPSELPSQAMGNFPPLPSTTRGHATMIDLTVARGAMLAYPNGRNVVLRDLENPKDSKLFTDHFAVVNVVRFSPNGEWVASGDEKGRVLVWARSSFIVKNDVQALRCVTDLAWSDDGKRIVVCGDGEQRVKCFPWDSGNKLGNFEGPAKKLQTVDFKPSRPYRIATAGEDFRGYFYEGPPFKFNSKLSNHSNYINCLRYSPDGNFFATCSTDKTIFLFDGKTGETIRQIGEQDPHKGGIYSLVWSPDSTQLLTASADKTCRLWNIEDGSLATTFGFGGTTLDDMQVAVAWKEGYIISVSLSGVINLLDLTAPEQPKMVLQGFQTLNASHVVAAVPGTVFVGDVSGRVTEWDVETGLGKWWNGSAGSRITQVAVSCDGTTLYTLSQDDILRASTIADASISAAGMPIGGAPRGLAVGSKTPDLVATICSKNVLTVFRGGRAVATQQLSFDVLAIAISPDEDEVAVSGMNKKVVTFKLDGDALTATGADVGKGRDDINVLVYSPDGRVLTAADAGRNCFMHDRASDHAIINEWGWKIHNAKLNDAQWSASSSLVVTCSADEQIIVFRDTQGFEVSKRTIIDHTHKGGVYCCKLLDEDTAVSGGGDDFIRLWNIQE